MKVIDIYENRQHVACIADIHEESKGKSWCGRNIKNQFHFVDIDHAAINGRNNGRLEVCSECMQEIISSLKAGNECNQ